MENKIKDPLRERIITHGITKLDLSPVQSRIALLFLEGKGIKEIANSPPRRSIHTIKNQTHLILEKIGVKHSWQIMFFYPMFMRQFLGFREYVINDFLQSQQRTGREVLNSKQPKGDEMEKIEIAYQPSWVKIKMYVPFFKKCLEAKPGGIFKTIRHNPEVHLECGDFVLIQEVKKVPYNRAYLTRHFIIGTIKTVRSIDQKFLSQEEMDAMRYCYRNIIFQVDDEFKEITIQRII